VELRLSGTRYECGKVLIALREAFPDTIEKVSGYYPNKRPGEEGTGRVYVTLKAEI
jgi:hypothetical protein